MHVDQKLIDALEPLVRRVRTDVTAVKNKEGRQAWTREPLTRERLALHLAGGPARGVCPIRAGQSVTMVGLLDLDSHRGEADWARMADAAERVFTALQAVGLSPVAFRSSGGRGMHIYVLWDEPQDAYSVRQVLIEAIGCAGFTNGAGGVVARQIEVFPKQDSVPADGFGNQFILPLAGKSEPLDPMDFEPLGRDAITWVEWAGSTPVALREKPAPTARDAAPAGEGAASRALWAIPNDIDDRDTWFKVMCAAKEAGVDKEDARAWTAQHPSYREDAFDGPWESIKTGDPEGAPAEYLFQLAERHGWDERVKADFTPVTAAAASADDAWPTLTRDRAGRIEPSITNTVAALRHAGLSGVRLGRDTFKDAVMVAFAGEDSWRALRDTDYTQIRMQLETRGFKNPGRELVRDAALKVAEDCRFDSAMQWGQALKWDGVHRVDTCMQRYFGAEDSPYARAVGRYLWTALAGRLLTPGEEVHMAVVLVGRQGSGKSRGVRALAPEPDAYVEINLEHRDDNLARSLRGKLVGELGELRGLQSKDSEAIKAWLSRSHEEWTPKYMEFTTKFPRRLVFIGTTNSDEFLADDTGERRWLPINVGDTDLVALTHDRDQLWAEAIALYHESGVQWLDAQALALDEHDKFKVEDAWTEPIKAWLQSTVDYGEGNPARYSQPVKITTVLESALGLQVHAHDTRALKRAAKVLRALGFEKKRAPRSAKGKSVWVAAKNCVFNDCADLSEFA